MTSYSRILLVPVLLSSGSTGISLIVSHILPAPWSRLAIVAVLTLVFTATYMIGMFLSSRNDCIVLFGEFRKLVLRTFDVMRRILTWTGL